MNPGRPATKSIEWLVVELECRQPRTKASRYVDAKESEASEAAARADEG